MKLAIVGSRSWRNRGMIRQVLRDLKPELLISGGAAGADWIAAHEAATLSIPISIYLPDWGLEGRRAGAIRNQLIVNECDKLVAFWDGKSKGTKISIDMAKKAGKLLSIYYETL